MEYHSLAHPLAPTESPVLSRVDGRPSYRLPITSFVSAFAAFDHPAMRHHRTPHGSLSDCAAALQPLALFLCFLSLSSSFSLFFPLSPVIRAAILCAARQLPWYCLPTTLLLLSH